MNGVDATQRHNASLNDLTAKIDAGLPVIVLVNSGSGTPHWVTIYGYTTDSSGNVNGVKMRDSYWGTRSGHTMGIEEFKAAWSDPVGNKLPNSLLGYSNLMIDRYRSVIIGGVKHSFLYLNHFFREALLNGRSCSIQ